MSDMEIENLTPDELPQKPDIKETLSALKDDDSTTALYGLSNLISEEVKQILGVWSELPSTQRRKLLRDMVSASETDVTLSFEEVAKLNLTDPDADVRSAAIEVLWENESVEHLRQLNTIAKNDTALQVRIAAMSAIGKFILLGEYGEIPEEEIASVQETLIDIWNDERLPVELRRRALEAISNGSHEMVPNAIREAYKSDDTLMTISALFAMGASYDNQWEELVIKELDNDDAEIQYEAAKAAGALSITEAIPKLAELTTSGDREILEVVISSLGEIGGNESLRFLNILAEQAEEQEDEDLTEAIDEAISIASAMGSEIFLDDID